MAALDSWLPEYRTCGGKERDEENDGGEKTVNDRGEYKRERERESSNSKNMSSTNVSAAEYVQR